MATTVGTVYVDVKFNVGNVARQLQAQLAAAAGGAGGASAAAAASMERSFSQAATNIGTKMQSVGRQMTMSLTLPLALIGKSAVSSFAQFDKAMTQIQAVNQQSAEDVERWRTEVRDLGKEYGIAAEEAAEGLYFITSSGIDAAHATEVLNVAMKASAVGLGETKVVADVLTSALSAYAKTTLTAAKVGDQLAAAVRLGKGEADELAGSLSQVIPIAANLNVSFGEVAGAMAAMTLSGTSSDQAATQLRGLFNTLMDLPPIGQKALATYTGLDFATLRLKIGSEGLIPILKQIYDGFGDNKEAMAEVFGNIRALTGVFNLFGQNTERTMQIIDEVTHATGDLNKAWEITAQSKSKQFEKAMNNVHDAMIGMGSEIMPAITPIIEGVGTLAGGFSKLPGPIQSATVTLGVFAAAAGPVTYALGSMVRGIGAIGKAVTTVTPTLSRFGSALATQAQFLQDSSVASGGLFARLGGLKAAVGAAGAIAAGAAISYALWSNRMDEAAGRAEALKTILTTGVGRGIEGSQKQRVASEKEILKLRKDIAKSSAPWDADIRAEWEMYINKLKEGNTVLREREVLAQQVAGATKLDADAVNDWLAEQYVASGKTYKSVQEVKDALTEGYLKGEEGAKAVADANEEGADSFTTLIERARGAYDAFTKTMDAEENVADALKGVAEANRKVTDAQEKYHDAQRKTIEADRKIADAQRKVTDAVQSTVDARQKLVDAQKELNDAMKGEQEKLDLESAKIGLAEAQKRARGSFDDPLDRRRAQLDVRRARMALAEAQGAQAKNIADAQRGVRDAQEGVTDAIQAEVDARQAVVDAQEDRTQAAKDEAEANADIAIAKDGIRTAEKNLADAHIAAKFAQDELNASIEKSQINGNALLTFFHNLATEFPALKGTLDKYTEEFNKYWRAVSGTEVAKETKPPEPPKPPEIQRNPPPQNPGLDVTNPLLWMFRSAHGNPLSAGQISTVNERGVPELWSANGRQYLLPLDDGRVTPLKPLDVDMAPRGGDGVTIGDIYVQGAESPVATAYEVRRQLRQKTRTGGRG